MAATFATVNAAAATFALHPTEADAAAAAEASDHLLVLIAEDLSELTMPQGAALFAATAAPLGIAPVKRFPDRATAARRIRANLAALPTGCLGGKVTLTGLLPILLFLLRNFVERGTRTPDPVIMRPTAFVGDSFGIPLALEV